MHCVLFLSERISEECKKWKVKQKQKQQWYSNQKKNIKENAWEQGKRNEIHNIELDWWFWKWLSIFCINSAAVAIAEHAF